MIDFDNVVLSKIDLLYLKTAKESDAIWLEPEKAACLLELGFIEPYLRYGGTHHFSITQDGQLFLNYQEHQEQIDNREQRKWKKRKLSRVDWNCNLSSNVVCGFDHFLVSAKTLIISAVPCIIVGTKYSHHGGLCVHM